MTKTVAEARAELLAPGAHFELREGRYRNAPGSLRAVFESTRQHGDDDAIVYEGERLTFAQQHAAVAQVARALRKDFTISQGDRVVLAMRNLPEFVIAFWAVQVLGAVAVPLNAWWTGPELAWAVADAAPKLAILDGERYQRLNQKTDEVPLIVTRPTAEDQGIPWRDLVENDPGGDLPEAGINPDDPATILYTSGTTGRPKGAVATHRNHCSLLMATAFQAEVGARTSVSTQALTTQPALLNPFPFFHIGGLSSMYLAGAGGVKQVLLHKWDTATALELCGKERITNLAVVPTMLRRLLEDPGIGQHDLSGIAAIGVGGSAGVAELAPEVAARFGPEVSVNHGWGLTETTSSACQHNGASFLAKPASVGLPTPGTELRITAEDGTEQPPGEPGEIWVRGPQVVSGYWNNPEATAESFGGGWFRSGDIGALDADGYLTVLDRVKDVIIRGGENIYSAEVEAVLQEHPAVDEVAVVGLPDRDLGEIVAAVIVPAENENPAPDELRNYAARHLAAFKVPSVVVIRDTPLPRNATGKSLKRELRAELTTKP